MDVALILDKLVPGAKYSGSLTANTQAAYEAIFWEDEREKPSWEELLAVPTPIDFEGLASVLETIFIEALRTHDGLLPAEAEGDLFILKAGIMEMLRFGRLAAARAKIEAVVLPEELSPIKQAMLNLLPA